MRQEQLDVLAFHIKLGVSPIQHLDEVPPDKRLDSMLRHVGSHLLSYANQLQGLLRKYPEDSRILRAHLMIEELGECIRALATRDDLEVFDGLCDLLYVTLGTGAQLDYPLAAGFDEVHRSNMTKERQPTDPDGDRLRDKGPNYDPPKLQEILDAHRKP